MIVVDAWNYGTAQIGCFEPTFIIQRSKFLDLNAQQGEMGCINKMGT